MTNIDDDILAQKALILPLSIGKVDHFDNYIKESLLAPFEELSKFNVEASNLSESFKKLNEKISKCTGCNDYINLFNSFKKNAEKGYNSLKDLFNDTWESQFKNKSSELSKACDGEGDFKDWKEIITSEDNKSGKSYSDRLGLWEKIKEVITSKSYSNKLKCGEKIKEVISGFMKEDEKKKINEAIGHFKKALQDLGKITDRKRIDELKNEINDNAVNTLLEANVAFVIGVDSIIKKNLPLLEALASKEEDILVKLAASLTNRGLIDMAADNILIYSEQFIIPVENLLDNLDNRSYGMMSLAMFGFDKEIDDFMKKITFKVILRLQEKRVPVLSFGRACCNAMKNRSAQISRYKLIPRIYRAIINEVKNGSPEIEDYLKALKFNITQNNHQNNYFNKNMFADSTATLILADSTPPKSSQNNNKAGEDDFEKTHFKEYVVADLTARQVYAARNPDKPIDEGFVRDFSAKLGEEIIKIRNNDDKKTISGALEDIGKEKPELYFNNIHYHITTNYPYELYEKQSETLNKVYENLNKQLQILSEQADAIKDRDRLFKQQIEALKKISDNLEKQLEKLQEQGKQHEQQSKTINKIYDNLSVKPESPFYNLCKEMAGSARCIPIDNDTFIIDIEQPFDTGKWEDEKIKGLLKKVKDEIKKEVGRKISAEVYGYASELDKVLTCNQLSKNIPKSLEILEKNENTLKLKVKIGEQYDEFTCYDNKKDEQHSHNDTLSLIRAAWVADQIKDSFEISKIDYKGASFASEGDSHFDRRVRIIFKTEEQKIEPRGEKGGDL